MSIVDVRPFFRSRLEGLGFIEHDDAFDLDNVASTLLDDSFHIESGTIQGSGANQLNHDFDYAVTITLFKRGFSNPVEADDAIDQLIRDIHADILEPSVRLGTSIKDVVPGANNRSSLSDSNDNSIILKMEFTARVIDCFS